MDLEFEMDWDVFTTITGTIATLSTVAVVAFPPSAPIAGPIAAVTGFLFSYGTNKGGKSHGLDPNDLKKVLVEKTTVEITAPEKKEKADA